MKVDNLKELQNIAKSLERSLKGMLSETDKMMNDLTPEDQDKVKDIRLDIKHTMDSVRKGDTSKLNKLYEKYANNNS